LNSEEVKVETLVATDHDRKAKGRSRVIGEGEGKASVHRACCLGKFFCIRKLPRVW
jgi:hypothetical protein